MRRLCTRSRVSLCKLRDKCLPQSANTSDLRELSEEPPLLFPLAPKPFSLRASAPQTNPALACLPVGFCLEKPIEKGLGTRSLWAIPAGLSVGVCPDRDFEQCCLSSAAHMYDIRPLSNQNSNSGVHRAPMERGLCPNARNRPSHLWRIFCPCKPPRAQRPSGRESSSTGHLHM